MKITLTGIATALAVSAVIAAHASIARADYPERPVNMVIPYGAGGATDISARTLAGPLGELSPEPLVMVNRTGAGGATGSVSVKNARNDGYTMLFARVGSHSVSPAMKAALPYTLDDFTFVGVYEINPVACAVSAESDIESIEDLVARVAEEPGRVSYSSSGVGSLLHLAGVMVLREFGIEEPLKQTVHIPLKGGGAAATAVLNGTATFICTNSSALASFVQNRQLRPILVTTPEPITGFDAPTARDLGKPSLHQLVGWTGIAGPRGLDDDIANQWRSWLEQATADEGFVSQMEARGSVIRLMNPEESRRFIDQQYRTFRKLVDDLGMRIEG